MGHTNDLMVDILFFIIKLFTFFGTICFFAGMLCAYMGPYFEDKKDDFMYMATAYTYWSLILIVVHIIETKA